MTAARPATRAPLLRPVTVRVPRVPAVPEVLAGLAWVTRLVVQLLGLVSVAALAGQAAGQVWVVPALLVLLGWLAYGPRHELRDVVEDETQRGAR